MFQHQKPTYDIKEGFRLLGIGRSHGYKEMKVGRLEYVKNGRRTQLTARGIDKYIELLEREAEAYERFAKHFWNQPTRRAHKDALKKDLQNLKRAGQSINRLFGKESSGLMPQRSLKGASERMRIEHAAVGAAAKVAEPLSQIIRFVDQALDRMGNQRGVADKDLIKHELVREIACAYKEHIGQPEGRTFYKVVRLIVGGKDLKAETIRKYAQRL